MGEVSPIATPLTESEVRTQLDELDVDAPRVGIVMGSESDMEKMQKAAAELEVREIMHELRVMSAHREPDVVAEYAKNAQMRGLRVIIAGAGISAALPGAVAAHTDLPVIGVPLSGRLTAAGGLDAILSIVQMPPGVPVACVGLDNARNAAILAAQIIGGVIDALHAARAGRALDRRGAHGDVAARRGRRLRRAAWLLGQDGPAPASSRRSGRRRFTVEAVNERERYRPRPRGVRRRARRLDGRGGTLDPLRPDLLRRARHGPRAAAAHGGRIVVAGARELVTALVERAREHVDTLCIGRTHGVHAEPTTFGDQARGFRLRGAPQRAAPASARSSRPPSARSRARSARTPRPRPSSRSASSRASTSCASRSPRRSSRATATPTLLGAIALAGAGLERLATEVRHLQRTEVREAQEPFRAGPEGLSVDAAQAQSNQQRAASAGSRASCAATPRPGSRTSRCGTSATSRTPRVERVVLPDSTILIDYMQQLATRSSRASRRRRADAREPRAHTRRALLPARAARARRRAASSRDDAYCVAQELAQRAWDDGHAAARAARRRPRAAALDLDAIFDYRALHAPRAARSSRGSTRSPETAPRASTRVRAR